VRLLIVKTSSMGDVVHATAVVHDILQALPDAEIDWLVEPVFADIVRLHPGVSQVLLLPWRKWRKQLLQRQTWAAMGQLRQHLRERRYDLVLDLQGLLKSAGWARQAQAPVAGYDRQSIREPLAAWAYARAATVRRDAQAVWRCRQLVAQHLGYALPDTPPVYELRPGDPVWQPAPGDEPGDAPGQVPAYAVLIPNASRPEKHWPVERWQAVGCALRDAGRVPVVLWGNAPEQQLAQRIAAGCGGQLPPFLKVGEMAALLAAARQVVGLDTGFTHLAAALGRPTVGIYCDHEPGLAGLSGTGPQASIGGKGQLPELEAVLRLVAAQTHEETPGRPKFPHPPRGA
jgi:heptosyltransferase-1